MADVPNESSKLPSAHAKRLGWALDKYGHLLAEAVGKDVSAEALELRALPEAEIPERLVRSIMEKADPTQAKTMTAWIVKQYAASKLRLEDTGTAHETLEMFDRYSPNLPIEQRDIGRYPDLASAWKAVLPFATEAKEKLSGRAQKTMDRDKAYAESRILGQDDDGFTVAVPLTEFAAKWWGRGTRWCTAAEKNNQFRHYYETAPLTVIVIPELKERGKFQLWVTATAFQFMDPSDEPVSEFLVSECWPRFKPVFAFALQQNGQALKYVPEKLRTEDMCRMAVAQNGQALQYVPEKLRAEEVCRIAVAQRGWALRYVPQKLRTEEISRIAVAQNGRALQYVPERFRTVELCRIAVTQHGAALECVPETLRTEEMYKIAVAQHGLGLEWVPAKLHTEEMYRIAVAQNGLSLLEVPKKQRTEDLCKIAVTQNGWALRDVPEALLSEEMCRIAVSQNGAALQFVPASLRSEATCKIALATNGGALWAVPEKLRTGDLCKVAVAKCGLALKDVPEDLCSEEMCRIAVAQDGRAFVYVPTHLRVAIEPFVKQKQELPQSPTWDPSLLDGLEKALSLYKIPEVEHLEEKPTSWIQRKLIGIAERLKSVRNSGNSLLP